MYVSPIANDILAGHLINYGAVSFMTDSPMRLKSGLVTPIYVDNRSLTAHPDAWRDIIETMCSRIAQLGLKFDIIAGVEGAGVSHARWLIASANPRSSCASARRPTATTAVWKVPP